MSIFYEDQYKQAVAKAIGKDSLNQQEAPDIENCIKDAMKSLAKKDINEWRNLSDSEKLIKAGEFVATDIQEQLKRKHKKPFECELNGDSSHQLVAPDTQLPSQVTIIDVGYTFLNEEELLAFNKRKIE